MPKAAKRPSPKPKARPKPAPRAKPAPETAVAVLDQPAAPIVPEWKEPEGMTDRQRKFAYAYAECGIGTDAAQKAGYQGNYEVLAVTGSNLLRHPKVRAIIDHLTEATVTTHLMGRQERMEMLGSIARGECEVDDYVAAEGVVTKFRRFPNAAERLKAADMLAKMNADYVERKEETHVHYLVEVPMRAVDSKEWAKQVEAEVRSEKKPR